ncbi:hypothetical protein BS50DRAFT_658531 [Corynespora cassiicola Philippines]|uniref:Xylanolytic transcriptional activator regulatory domain-containing protein n=1 Tax=Corynespora cassiicola Philippines TaxID=1448308 RepID=A0A2T2P4F3_CORCC|nr:hypothetical protein BS50DRAFT_658531 [Corynespora cassiicola Philippines]
MQYTPSAAGSSSQPKIAIPRLERREPDKSLEDSKKHRASKALPEKEYVCSTRITGLSPLRTAGYFADRRQRLLGSELIRSNTEVKCSGDIPICITCRVNNTECVYDPSRRDRLREATNQKQNLVSLLRELSLHVDDDYKRRIKNALEDADIEEPTSPIPESRGKRQRRDSQPGHGHERSQSTDQEAHVSASVGSNEDLDVVGEDLLRSQEASSTGFLGQNSEVHWLQSLERQMNSSESEPARLPYGPPGAGDTAKEERTNAYHERQRLSPHKNSPYIADFSFYLDNEDLDLDIMVDPFELPTAETAERLFDCYVKAVHSPFPILHNSFHHQFRQFYDAIKKNKPYQVSDKWKALLNLVFAIGAKHSHLVRANWQGDDRDHIIYASRAIRLLRLKDFGIIMAAPDLTLIQGSHGNRSCATGLLCFYYLATGRVNRAWIVIGISLRFAVSIGLHLRNEDPNASVNRKEDMVRTWWALRSVECILGAIEGRPCIISEEDTTARLPGNNTRSPNIFGSDTDAQSRYSTFRRHSSTNTTSSTISSVASIEAGSSFLVAHIKIGLITQKVLKSVYSARTAVESWGNLQKEISNLLRELEGWAQESQIYSATPPDIGGNSDSLRERMLLRMYHSSTKMLITRPCLCRIERRIPDQSRNSANFNDKTAGACIEAAKDLAQLLPDEPNPRYIYELGPWWSMTHNIVQALAVFLLEICYSQPHLSSRQSSIAPQAKKLLLWLKSMTEDPVSQRAYQLIMSMLQKSKVGIYLDMTELGHDASPETRGNEVHSYAKVNEVAKSCYWNGQNAGLNLQTVEFQPAHPQAMPNMASPGENIQGPYAYLHNNHNSHFSQSPAIYNNPFMTPLDQYNPWSANNMDTGELYPQQNSEYRL